MKGKIGSPGEMKLKTARKHNRGVEIARQLFPGLIIEPPGTWWDRAGIDGFLDGEPVQIKFDGRMALSGNIYHEVYEKSAYHPEQPWRTALGKVTHYIFTTEDTLEIVAVLLSVDSLAVAERGKPLQCIKPNLGAATSLGYLIPCGQIKQNAQIKREVKKSG